MSVYYQQQNELKILDSQFTTSLIFMLLTTKMYFAYQQVNSETSKIPGL